ncbi:MAG: hypothetical protein LBC86_08605 [Oscillospiraceae bacterium]|jgi:cation transport ATPase|nr:hypothetical protein [Oscillospiraceae bacterium]
MAGTLDLLKSEESSIKNRIANYKDEIEQREQNKKVISDEINLKYSESYESFSRNVDGMSPQEMGRYANRSYSEYLNRTSHMESEIKDFKSHIKMYENELKNIENKKMQFPEYKNQLYNNYTQEMKNAQHEFQYEILYKQFRELGNFEDAVVLAETCNKRYLEIRKRREAEEEKRRIIKEEKERQAKKEYDKKRRIEEEKRKREKQRQKLGMVLAFSFAIIANIALFNAIRMEGYSIGNGIFNCIINMISFIIILFAGRSGWGIVSLIGCIIWFIILLVMAETDYYIYLITNNVHNMSLEERIVFFDGYVSDAKNILVGMNISLSIIICSICILIANITAFISSRN